MKNIIDWMLDPIVECLASHFHEEEIKQAGINFKIPKNSSLSLYRPDKFIDYIGQSRAKNTLKSYIDATKTRQQVMPHILIHGKAGCGKTTLARIVAKELGVNYKEIITSTIKCSFDLISQINEVDGGILFLDEIHALDRPTAESIYMIMEDFRYNQQSIKPFTLIGATTEMGELIKDRRPFVDRFKIHIELENYSETDLSKMMRQYRNMVFPKDELSDETFDLVSKNCRLTPRIGIRLLESIIYLNGDIKTALNNAGIIKDGYTEKDLKILRYIEQNDKGVGLQGLASYLGTSTKNYENDIEPYLLQNNLIVRTPRGRKITVTGKSKIQELQA